MHKRLLRPAAAVLVALGMGLTAPRAHASATPQSSTTASGGLIEWLLSTAETLASALSLTGESGSNLAGESGSNLGSQGSTTAYSGESGSNVISSTTGGTR